MAVKAPPILFAWISVVILAMSWVLLLAGAGALQATCGSVGASSLLRAGSANYLAPVSCNRFYSYVWWTVWYAFFALIATSAILSSGVVHKFRYGLVGIFIPLTYLLMSTSDVALALSNLGVTPPRAKTLLAGSIISSIFYVVLIILVGIHDEQAI